MVERDRETVVVENGTKRSSSGLTIFLIILGLIILFFLFGGLNMFNGANTATPTGGGASTAPTTSTGAGE